MNIHDKIDSISRAVQAGLMNGKKNMIVDLEVLAVLTDMGRFTSIVSHDFRIQEENERLKADNERLRGSISGAMRLLLAGVQISAYEILEESLSATSNEKANT